MIRRGSARSGGPHSVSHGLTDYRAENANFILIRKKETKLADDPPDVQQLPLLVTTYLTKRVHLKHGIICVAMYAFVLRLKDVKSNEPIKSKYSNVSIALLGDQIGSTGTRYFPGRALSYISTIC